MTASPPGPSFFLIGAPKCGTTALASYLADHPAILFSEPKEPKYFNTDFSNRHRVARTPADYESCFEHGTGGDYAAVGEGTVWYLYSREAVPNILRFDRGARFIVMIRSPTELVRSLHAQLLHGGVEDIDSIEQAWRMQHARRRGASIPRLCPDPKVLLYGEVAKIGSQLERLYELVDSARVHVLMLDELARDPLDAYRRTLAFLDVEPDDRQSFPVVNPGRRIAAPRLARLLYFGKWAKDRLGIDRSLGVWRTLSPLLSRPSQRPPLRPAFRAELDDYFHPEIDKLERTLGIDLSGWKKPATSAAGEEEDN